jgi:cytochrome c oxidase subunit 2
MSHRTHPLRRGAVAIGAVLTSAAVLAGCGGNDNEQNSLQPKGPEARQIMDLFTPFFWLAVVIGIGVIGGTIYVALRFREKPGEERNPQQVHGNTVLEVGWTIVPALILLLMAAFTIPVIFDLAEAAPSNALHVNVVAKQWFWEYEYCKPDVRRECADDDVDFVTANELHIPVDRPVALHISAPPDGVIHSFWVPNLAGKKDAVPGRTHFLKLEADQVGEFRGQCAEYCGLSHANMRLRVFVQPEQDYATWVRAQRQGLSGAAAEFVSTNLVSDVPDTDIQEWGCTQCHAFAGVEGAGARIGPSLTHLGDRSTFASALFDTNLENLTKWVYDAPSQKPFGDYDNAMPSFKDAGMTEDEAAEIARFLLCDTATDASEVPADVRTSECAGGSG